MNCGRALCPAGLLQRMVRHGSRPRMAATAGLPHPGRRRGRTTPAPPEAPLFHVGIRLRPITDNYLSATEGQNPFGVRVPNDDAHLPAHAGGTLQLHKPCIAWPVRCSNWLAPIYLHTRCHALREDGGTGRCNWPRVVRRHLRAAEEELLTDKGDNQHPKNDDNAPVLTEQRQASEQRDAAGYDQVHLVALPGESQQMHGRDEGHQGATGAKSR